MATVQYSFGRSRWLPKSESQPLAWGPAPFLWLNISTCSAPISLHYGCSDKDFLGRYQLPMINQRYWVMLLCKLILSNSGRHFKLLTDRTYLSRNVQFKGQAWLNERPFCVYATEHFRTSIVSADKKSN
ncbi:hypothetical protein Y1Q_0009773 [Alligator mississippiensis]|uniref:Uncharacterized protein n=1 Tax=Alligator mississippiensis TaxID=8496 RepID=A0A151MWM3_ALLMI|nr:hypothetical protein Y1Q_0009773 [Alligator mississippiensis]